MDLLDMLAAKQRPGPTREEDFYAIVSAIAQFIEKVDIGEGATAQQPEHSH